MPRSRPRRSAAIATPESASSMYQVPCPMTATSRFVGPNRRLSMVMTGVSMTSRRMLAPARGVEQLDHLAIERRDVVGAAAGHQVPVDHHFPIDPVRSSVLEIGLEGRP